VCCNRDSKIQQLLINRGTYPTLPDELETTANWNGRRNLLRCLLEYPPHFKYGPMPSREEYCNKSKLIRMNSDETVRGCRYGSPLAFAQFLLDYHQPYDSDDRGQPGIHHPLIGAVKYHDKELIMIILKAGAKVNKIEESLLYPESVLRLAVKLEDLDIMSCLIEAGADINSPAMGNKGTTALQ
jgi:hypothetical protein